MKDKRFKKQILSIFTIAIFLLLALCSVGEKESPDKNIEKVEQVENRKYIPGIAAADLHINLTSKGFEFEKKISTDYCYWKCSSKNTSYLYEAIAYGDNALSIYKIEATALNYSSKSTAEITKDFLGYIASLPYENATPEVATSWIKNNIDKNAIKIISGVKFELTANSPRARILTLTPIK